MGKYRVWRRVSDSEDIDVETDRLQYILKNGATKCKLATPGSSIPVVSIAEVLQLPAGLKVSLI